MDRDTLARKNETNLSESEHLSVKAGDIVYNMMRMWQGASGLAEKDGIVSPAYIVLAPNNLVSPLYASYLFKTQRLIYLFWAYSYGLTSDRLRLYFRDFSKIPVNVPDIKVQNRISKIISDWDRAICLTEALVKNSQSQKKVLLSSLLTGAFRHQGFCGKKKIVRLKDVLIGKKIKGKKVVVSCNNIGMPYIGAASFDGEFSNFTIDKEAVLCERKDLLVLWDGEYSGKATTNIRGVVSSTVVKYRVNLTKVDNQYLNYCFLFDNQRIRSIREGSGIPHMPKGFDRWYKFWLPSIQEQGEIVAHLSSIDKQIGHLKKKLDCLLKEKKGLMQQLLVGKRLLSLNKLPRASS